MRRLAALLALLLAAPLVAQSPGAAYKLDQVAVRLDGGAGGSGFSTPSGCVATSVPIFLGSPVALGCDAGLTYDAATDTLTTPTVSARNVTVTALATPTITSPLTVNGTPGATTYGYKLTARAADSTTTAASAEVTIATGNATLDGTNNITVAWPAVTGAATYKLYRTTGGAAPPKLIYTGALLNFSDIGAAGTAETPATVNTTGVVTGDRLVGVATLGAGSTVAKGTGTATATLSGVLSVITAALATSGTAEQSLATYVLPGGTLSADSKGIRIVAFYSGAANTNTKLVKIKFGSTYIVNSSHAVSSTVMAVTAYVIRTGAATQAAWSSLSSFTAGTSAAVGTNIIAAPTETLSGDVTIDFRGTTATAAGDLTFHGAVIEAVN